MASGRKVPRPVSVSNSGLFTLPSPPDEPSDLPPELQLRQLFDEQTMWSVVDVAAAANRPVQTVRTWFLGRSDLDSADGDDPTQFILPAFVRAKGPDGEFWLPYQQRNQPGPGVRLIAVASGHDYRYLAGDVRQWLTQTGRAKWRYGAVYTGDVAVADALVESINAAVPGGARSLSRVEDPSPGSRRRRYDPGVRRQAVQAVLGGATVATVAAQHGVVATTLTAWVAAYRRERYGPAAGWLYVDPDRLPRHRRAGHGGQRYVIAGRRRYALRWGVVPEPNTALNRHGLPRGLGLQKRA